MCKIAGTSGLEASSTPGPFGKVRLQAKIWNRGTKSTTAMPSFDNRAILAWKRFIAFLILTDLEESHELAATGHCCLENWVSQLTEACLPNTLLLFSLAHFPLVYQPGLLAGCGPVRFLSFSHFSFTSFQGVWWPGRRLLLDWAGPTSWSQWFSDSHSACVAFQCPSSIRLSSYLGRDLQLRLPWSLQLVFGRKTASLPAARCLHF